MSEEKTALEMALDKNQEDPYQIPDEDFFETTLEDLDAFDEKAHNKGMGYVAPNYPLFSQYMEGLESGFYMFAGESNTGKALRLSTPILKTDGRWTTIGDIKIGDKVWGDDGKPTTVVCKSKLFHDHTCYKMTLDDGTVIHADADHLWRVYKYCCHKPNNREMVLRTEDMFKNFKHVNPDGYPRYKYRIPMQKPFQYPKQELPLHPYVLGTWLGDGDERSARLNLHIDDYEEQRDLLTNCGVMVGDVRQDKRVIKAHGSAANCTLGEKFFNGFGDGHNDVLDALRELNVLCNKHIPAKYLHGSIEQRWELLRGLMDTDGSVEEHGLCEFTQKASSKIIADFGELLGSLGIKYSVRNCTKKCTTNGKEFPATRFYFACDKTNPCFKMQRKIDGLRDKLKDRTCMYRTVVNIEEIPTETMQCIEVNNASHCFCVGKTLAVTHNTATMLNIMRDFALHEPNKLFGIYFSLDDSCDEVFPRLIAMDQLIPISVGSKPQRYQEIIDEDPDCEESMIARSLLEKRELGLQRLRETNDRFKVVDKSKVKYGEQILNYCIKLQSWLKAKDPEANIIVGIDSLSDMRFPSQRFDSDKTRNDYIARTVKEWAVTTLDCPIFGSLHLKKLGANRRPMVDDVKESGEYIYEASTLFLVHNDVNKNKENATIFDRVEGNEFKQPVIELDWAKNKKSSFKGITYHHFTTNFSKVTECSQEQSERFRALAQSL